MQRAAVLPHSVGLAAAKRLARGTDNVLMYHDYYVSKIVPVSGRVALRRSRNDPNTIWPPWIFCCVCRHEGIGGALASHAAMSQRASSCYCAEAFADMGSSQ